MWTDAQTNSPALLRQHKPQEAEQRQIDAQLVERLLALAGHVPVPPQELAGSLMALARSQAINHVLYGAASAGAVLLTVLRGVFAHPSTDLQPRQAHKHQPHPLGPAKVT